jgi:cytochrome P450
MRNYIRELIRERRATLHDRKDHSDLLSIMLNDPLFQNNDEIILNESLTFFLAGSLTQASLLSNTLCYFIMDKNIMERAR